MSNKTALFIGYVWPEPNTTAAGQRMVQLLDAFLKHDFDIVFASSAQKTKYSGDLSQLGIKTVAIQLNQSSFDDFVKDLRPDLVVFDRFMVEEQFGWRVAEAAPKALRILNTEDLHSLRKTREEYHKREEEFSHLKWLENDITKRELASIYRSDLTLLISPVETKLLKTVFNISDDLILTLPFMLDVITEEKAQELPSFEERKDFIFIGNGKHAPNVDAIHYLKTTIWPLIRKELTTAELNIYGAYLPQQITEMHKPVEGFYVYGWLKNLEDKLQKSRINLAPLRFGAGLKGKVVDGMRNGTPTLTTAIGTEGISGFTTSYDGTTEFANKAIELYSNKNEWLKMQLLGMEISNTHFSRDGLANDLFSRIESLKSKLSEHRTKNFIGSLLQHQTMASTKFMSKWIEEKNKGK